jgi:tripartite-type tricarboxylate transporter receptor subunit TctC
MTVLCLRRAAIAIVLALALPAVAADDYPNKAIKLIVPFVPGGTADLMGRTIAQKLQQAWGKPVVVENRPGAGGNIAGAVVAQAPADGYTLLLGTVSTHGINPTLYPNMPYDAVKDFAPVAIIARVSNVLVVNPAVKANNVKELIALAKAQPGKLMFGSAGNGSSLHLSGELFAHMAQVQMTHVPYKGSAPALADLISGQTSLMFDNVPSALPHIKAGKLRPLAVTMSKRIPQLPNVPTVAEAGLPGFEAVSWFGVMAPAKTAPEIVAKLNGAINKILTNAQVRARLVDQGAEPATMSPEQFAEHIKSEIAKWGKVVKTSGARVDQ